MNHPEPLREGKGISLRNAGELKKRQKQGCAWAVLLCGRKGGAMEDVYDTSTLNLLSV